MSSSPAGPLCFCGRACSSDSAWFCSDACARQDSLNTLLGLPSSRSPPRPNNKGGNCNLSVGLPASPRSPSPALPRTATAATSKPPGWRSHYRTVEARRAAERRREVSKTKPAAELSHDRKSSLSSSTSRVSTLFSRPDTAHSSGSSLAPRSPPMTASSDRCVVEEGDESSFATCIDDEWAAIEALHGGDASSFDGQASPRKQHLSAKQMSNLQQRTVAELFEEIARAKQLTPWGTSLDSPSSAEFPFPARPDGADSETDLDLDVLNDDALAPFMGDLGPKCPARQVLDPAHVDVDLAEPRDAVRVAFPRTQPQPQPPRARQPSPPPPVASQLQPTTGGPSRHRHQAQPVPHAVAARASRTPLERFSATVLPAMSVRRQASKPSLAPPPHQDAARSSFLPGQEPTATPRFPHKARSSALLRLPATLGRGLDKLRSRMSSLPGSHVAPVLPASIPPATSVASVDSAGSVLDIGASGSTATILGPSPSTPALLAAFPPVPVASTSTPARRPPVPVPVPVLALDRPPAARTKNERHSVLADADASGSGAGYLLLRVPKMPPRAGAFPSTPSPFRSPATVFPPSPASSRPTSSASASSLLCPPSPLCTRSVEDVRHLSPSPSPAEDVRRVLRSDDSPSLEFYRDRPLPPLPAARARSPTAPAASPSSPSSGSGSGKLRLGQVMAMRAQSRGVRRVGSQRTVTPTPRIVVHPYARAQCEYASDEESSADESDADEAVDVLRRMRMHSPPRYAGLGLALPAVPLPAPAHSRLRRGVVDAL